MWVFVSIAAALQAQRIVIVSGILVDSVSQKPLDKATLIRMSDERPFLTDRFGTFEITCTDNDALRISFVGYISMRLVVRNIPDSTAGLKKFVRIEMRRDMSQLPQIIVNENPMIKNRKEDSLYYNYALKPMEATIMNPISFLYAQFSKSEKEKAKLNEIIQQNYFDDLLKYRLPKQLLYSITGDKTFNHELLKQKCRPTEFFLLNASDYDLYQWVKRCYEY